MHEVAGFLRGFPPFDHVSDELLERVVQSTEIEFFADGAFLLRAGDTSPGVAHVVRTGHVELMADGRVFDVVGPGELVGLPSLVSGLPTGVDARAAEDVLTYRIPADVLLPLLDGDRGLRFLARTVRERTPSAPHARLVETVAEPVGGLARTAILVDAAQPVGDVAVRMRDEDASSALVRMPDGSLGIVTDHDLRVRVLAAALDLTTPVLAVATSPVLTVRPELPADDAVLVLLAHGIRHLPVVRSSGEVLGVVEDVDLLAASTRTPVRLRRAIGRASGTDELVAVARSVLPAVLAAYDAGHPATTVTSTLSTLGEALVAKALELHVRERGTPPVPFVWLTTGSVARLEAMPGSDLDTLLAWEGDDSDGQVRGWMRSLATDVLATLVECGLLLDDNGVRADDPRFSRSVEAWRTAVREWAVDPTIHQADIYLGALGDARPVWGHAAWQPVEDELRAVHARPRVRSTLHRVATALSPPTGFVRDLVIESSGEHAGMLDLKRGGVAPVVAIGRYLAALLPGHPVSTTDRIRAAGSRALIREADAQDLVDAFDVVQTLRLEQQVRDSRSGRGAGDHLRPDDLTTLQRRSLRDSFRVVARAQRALPPPVARP
jgi:CBS domain-containing protein